MTIQAISSEAAEQQSQEELFAALDTSSRGLTGEEAASRLAQFGPNALAEEKDLNPILKFLGYFWGPIPWMHRSGRHPLGPWCQALGRPHHYLVLLIFDALVGFWQEYKAANALEALKKQLALTARVRRDGTWQEIPAEHLVPGFIRLRLGDIIPGDVKLLGTYRTSRP